MRREEALARIARRYRSVLQEAGIFNVPSNECVKRYLLAYNLEHPLRLSDMAEGRTCDLVHDVSGIMNGSERYLFTPRYQKRQ